MNKESNIILITGGARSGKSSFAETSAKEKSKKDVVYIATSLVTDKEMEDRIKKHRNNRPNDWITIENYNNIDTIIDNYHNKSVFLIDCITLMVSNLIYDFTNKFNNIDNFDKINDKILEYVNKIIIKCKNTNSTFLFVTNEVGMGIVPDNYISRVYRDIAGRTNQLLASNSKEVYLCVSGIPIKIK
ncbi:MAG: bifunctional adenosylcobinamide kinase/adenosylcobinamide-phosphate guanylyltransferase [Clostridiales bacterium]